MVLLLLLTHLRFIKGIHVKINQIIEYKRPKLPGAQNAITPNIQSSVEDIVTSRHGHGQEIWRPLEDQLKKTGWQSIGMGCFSIVFTKPSLPYVLKINKMPDRAFQHFVELSKRFPSRYFPKIGALKMIEYKERPYYIYTIEKLDSVTNMPSHLTLTRFANLIEAIAANPKMEISKILGDCYGASDESVEWFLRHPELVKACQIIGLNCPDGRLDIHKGNIMQRKDGTIVIVDPYVCWSDLGEENEDEI